jgi:FRG domain
VIELGEAATVSEFATLIDHIEDVEYLWFRGASNYAYELEPSLFRPSYGLADFAAVKAAESRVLTIFKQRSIPYVETLFIDRGGISDWNYLFLMQHFGVPTRLLDFTENAFTALYFAVSTSVAAGQQTDAVVYIVDPKLWNQQVFRNGSGTNNVLNPTDSDLDGYKPGNVTISKSPVCIFGDYNSRRIAVQQGTFVLFGSEKLSMDQYVAQHRFDPSSIYKIKIPAASIHNLHSSLRKFGFTESSIYPDIVGLSTDLRMMIGSR